MSLAGKHATVTTLKLGVFAVSQLAVVLVLACTQPVSGVVATATPLASLRYATVEATSQPTGSVAIELISYAFRPAEISVKAGKVSLYLVNTSADPHALSLRDETGPLLAVAAQSETVAGGRAAVFTIENLPAGTYRMKEPLALPHGGEENRVMVGVLIAH
jgi:plastocyanin